MNTPTTTIATPAGPLTIVTTDSGAVRAAGFTGNATDLLPPGTPVPAPRPDLGAISDAVRAYLAGDLTAIDEIPVAQPGTGLLALAWQALRESKPGEPLTYTGLALRAGRPAAVRAAANACARNAAALFVPCHRVVRTDGGLGGYRWGTGVKRWLLDHEQRT
jgi:methylated-DNA-[protein]-cysteine S-methyltransferase